MKTIKFLPVLCALLLLSAFTSEKTITIFMIGDSTMANKSLVGDNQERGWGHVLGGFFSEDIVGQSRNEWTEFQKFHR